MEPVYKRRAVFFDLDGTLLPMDQDEFIRQYFEEIQKSGTLEILGERGMECFLDAVGYEIGEHGQKSNEEAFCSRLEQRSGVKREVFLPVFEDFYRTRFDNVRRVVRPVPETHEALEVLKRKNYTLVLATSPIFPQVATDIRIDWAGLNKEDFVYVTYYENSRYAKPNLKYYTELLKTTGFAAEECYMVGNSVSEDLCAQELGFEVFIVKNFIVGDELEASAKLSGSYGDLLRWASALPEAAAKV